MIEVSERVTIPVPADEVWRLLSNPEQIIGCVPGANLDEVGPNGLYKATISVAFGPTVATFKGEAQVKYDDTARCCTVEGRGIDGRGASSALAEGTVTVSGTDTTELKVEGGFSIAGPLETFASAGGVHIARALLREFAENLTKFVEQQQGAAATDTATQSATPAAAPKAAAISARALLWKAFQHWLKSLFQKN
jgi:carbon monoxide dehydrogenase subunit G